jgi:erythromycin esterase-like protein
LAGRGINLPLQSRHDPQGGIGTSEFYRARAAITRRLIERHSFDIVAVEADWPDAAALDRHVRHLPPLDGTREPFRRFPRWMWRNTDVNSFVRWLREHNAGREEAVRAGFFGLDVYSLSDSIEAVLSYIDRADPEAGQIARLKVHKWTLGLL